MNAENFINSNVSVNSTIVEFSHFRAFFNKIYSVSYRSILASRPLTSGCFSQMGEGFLRKWQNIVTIRRFKENSSNRNYLLPIAACKCVHFVCRSPRPGTVLSYVFFLDVKTQSFDQ